MNTEKKITIIGGGISGLIAALELEKNGYHPTIIDANERLGGRVQTIPDTHYQLDLGFQVLLDAYPYAQKYLDLKKLDLKTFKPGAVIFNAGKKATIGDPLRDFSLFFPSLTSGIGTVGDKFKILKLNKTLKRKSIAEIFSSKEITTLEYLNGYGFSKQIIHAFFFPFFSGIFLESELNTSSRKFEFIFKMFATGNATIPKKGIQVIPDQLAKNLKNTKILLNTKVKQVKDNTVILIDDTVIENDFTIIATAPNELVTNLKDQKPIWKSCETLYFECTNLVMNANLIGLIPSTKTLINNIAYVSDKKQKNKYLLSVTIVKKHQLTTTELINQVQTELQTECNIETPTFVKRFNIKQALPQISDIRYDMEPSETRLLSTVFLAGDHLLNGSLNAAMISGKMAAKGVIEAIEGNFI